MSDNSEWSGSKYVDSKELQWATDRGITMKDTPELMQKGLDFLGQGNRPFVLGSTIYTPNDWSETETTQVDWEAFKLDPKKYNQAKEPVPMMDIPAEEIDKRLRRKYKTVISDEAPHVAQWREEGTIGFIAKHLMDLAKYGGGGATYDKDTHEAFHSDPELAEMLKGSLEVENPTIEDNIIRSWKDEGLFK